VPEPRPTPEPATILPPEMSAPPVKLLAPESVTATGRGLGELPEPVSLVATVPATG
jgi:hypothetical protein